MAAVPKVGIVLLNWNSYEDTAHCIESLDSIQYENYFTVIVDNNSTDGSGSKLQKDFPEHTVLFNERNRGFAGGANDGINYCIEKGADYVLLLNNDIKVSPNFLEPLVRTAERNEKVASVGGIIYHQNGDNIWDAGGELQPFFANHSKYKKIKSSEEYRSEFVTCAMNLLSKEFLSGHRLDEEFFFGVEEIDLAWRAVEEEWKLYINPNSKAYHNVGSATEDMFAGEELFSAFQKYHNTRGRLYHSRKNLRAYHTIFFYLMMTLVYPSIYLVMGIRYRRPDILYAHLLSIFDYFLGTRVRKPEYFQ